MGPVAPGAGAASPVAMRARGEVRRDDQRSVEPSAGDLVACLALAESAPANVVARPGEDGLCRLGAEALPLARKGRSLILVDDRDRHLVQVARRVEDPTHVEQREQQRHQRAQQRRHQPHLRVPWQGRWPAPSARPRGALRRRDQPLPGRSSLHAAQDELCDAWRTLLTQARCRPRGGASGEQCLG